MIKIKLYILFALLLLNFSELNAQGKYNIKIGTNYSTFNMENENPKPGILFGVGKEWRINIPFRNQYLIIR